MTVSTPLLTPSVLIVGLLCAAGCGHEATLVRDTADGGLVSYRYQTDAEVLASRGRRDAFRLI
ncbi:MAG TPA: hypothetical protein VFG71_02490, partial [Nitrospiraceae bacterium]|nr:hypothetical protein [Nitrospiraceae bacterium]